jgi:hypothetical protein
MSVLDQYTFTRSLSVLSSPSLASLLSCSLCSQPLSSTTALSSGKCPHAICQDCLSSHPGGSCPVSGCNIPAHTKDYQENRTLGQLARCLGNIKTLLENKVCTLCRVFRHFTFHFVLLVIRWLEMILKKGGTEQNL